MGSNFEIVANSAAPSPVRIRSMGFAIAAAATHLVEGEVEQQLADASTDELTDLTSDNAYPSSPDTFTHSLEIRELPGSIPVPPAEVAEFLDKAQLDSTTVNEIESGAGGGITQEQHALLDTQLHAIQEPYDLEVNYDGNGDVDRVTYWKVEVPARSTKIRETLITYDGNLDVATVNTTQYDSAGTVKAGEGMNLTISYDGNLDVDGVDGVIP